MLLNANGGKSVSIHLVFREILVCTPAPALYHGQAGTFEALSSITHLDEIGCFLNKDSGPRWGSL